MYLLVLFGLRLDIAMEAAGTMPGLAAWAPFLSAAVFGALQLRRGNKAADAFSIATVITQLGLTCFAIAAPAPAFFISSALLCASGLHLARRDARWLYSAYVGGYLAFQTCGQLVPAQLKVVLASLRTALHYPASQPLPPAYDAIYAAVFVVVVALIAWRLFLRGKPSGSVLLTCTTWASALVGAMGLESVAHDARPALWSAPVLAALCLTLGLALSRVWLTRVGTALIGVAAVALFFVLGPGAASIALGGLALGLACLSVFALSGHRQTLSLGSGVLAVTSVLLAFTR